MLIDTTKISLTTGATVCPNYQITIINDDGSELNSNVFTFDQTSSEFRIDTRDVSLSGTYQLKIVVCFDSSLYRQTSESGFTAILTDYSEKPYLNYDDLATIELPERKSIFPTTDFLATIPQENFKLSEIRYKTNNIYIYQLSSWQMVFANGVTSPVFEAPDASDDKLRSFTIDTTREIRTVRMFIKYGIYYMGIWLQDDEGETIVKEVWL